jgi:hypothetical protein
MQIQQFLSFGIAWLFIPFAFIPKITPGATFAISWITFGLSAFMNIVGGTIYLKKGGVTILKHDRWGDKAGYTVNRYLGERDSRLEELGDWGKNQLAPEWTYDFSNWTKEERDGMRKATLVDLNLGIKAECYIREWEEKPPNALIPLAVHGCGVTCLILHHHDDRLKAAVKLGIINLPPYILGQGVALPPLEVGAVKETPRPVSYLQWRNV